MALSRLGLPLPLGNFRATRAGSFFVLSFVVQDMLPWDDGPHPADGRYVDGID